MKKDVLTGTSSEMVSIDTIECFPGPYCMSFGYDLNPLMESIKNIGLLNSPILIASEIPRRLLIISGYRRIEVLKQMGYHTIPCKILQASVFDPLHCLLLNLYDNLSIRHLNDVEKAMVLVQLEKLTPEQSIVDDYLPILDLMPRRDVFLLYKRIAAELGETGKTALAKGTLSFQAVKMLLELEKNAMDAILYFFSNLRLNTNQQRQLIDFICDISIIEKRSVSNLLTEASIREIELDSRMNEPQKAKAMMKLFRQWRLPSVVQAERGFKKAISELALPKGVRITPPPFFEGSDYKMEISFRNGVQLKKALENLSSMESLADIGNPWEKNSSPSKVTSKPL
jgi:hypothetical protein